MKPERTIKCKSLYRHVKEKSFHHFVLKLDHQFSPFGFCQVKRNGENVNSLLFSVYKSSVTGGTLVGRPGTDPPCILHIAAEPTRQPTTKRRKRKNSTSSTSNSSGERRQQHQQQEEDHGVNLSLSSQVPVSLGSLAAIPALPSPPRPAEKTLSCKDLLRPAGGRWGGGRGRQGQELGGRRTLS